MNVSTDDGVYVEDTNASNKNSSTADNDETAETTTTPRSNKSRKTERYPKSFFTDDKGNLKFVNLVVRHPCKVFCSIFLLNILVSFLLVSVVFAGGNPFSDPDGEYDIKDIRSIDYDTLRLARDEMEAGREAYAAEIEGIQGRLVRAQEETLDITYWVFEGETEKGVFGSAKSIEGMKEALDLFTTHSEYDSYCWKEYSTDTNGTIVAKCRAPLSPLNIFYASEWDSATAQAIIDQLRTDYPANVDRYNDLALCVEFGVQCNVVSSNYTDNDFAWARALNEEITSVTTHWDGTGSLQTDILDEVSLFCAYVLELRTKRGFLDFGFDKDFSVQNPVSQFSRAVLSWGGPLNISSTALDAAELSVEDREEDDEEALKEYVKDNFLDDMNEISEKGRNPEVNAYFFMGTLILEVLLGIVTRDATLALISFLFVFLYLRFVVGSWFLACVGMAEIMLSIPVSWFLYNTVYQIEYFAFLNTLSIYIVAAIGADDIFIFMDAYKQSEHSKDPDILESLESRMSWVYRRTGTAMAITSATTCSAFLGTLITPLVGVRAFGVFAATVILIDYVLVMTLFCTAVVIYHNKFEKPGCCSGCSAVDPTSTERAMADVNSDESDAHSDRIGNFFRYKVSPFINNSKNRIGLAIVFIAWIVIAAINASKITPTKEAEQFLNEDHPFQKSVTILNNAFPIAEDDSGLPIHFVWGLDKVSRDGVRQLLNPKFLGNAEYKDTFDFDETCQSEMLRVCTELKQDSEYKPYIKQEGGFGSVSCFIEELGAYSVLGSLNDCDSVKSGAWMNETWQVAPADIPGILVSFVEEKSCYGDEGQSIMVQYEDNLGWNGTSLLFAGLAVESSVIDPFSTLPQATVREQYDKMIEIANQFDSAMEAACGGDTLMTDLLTKFVFMNNQRIYVRSALQSSLLGVTVAFIVLLLATRVVHIAFFATISIICVLVSVTGSMVLIGWDLGSIEAILISIVAGFSVDYVVHLSHAYVQASGDTSDRITTAFGEMGISVLNGMVTSVGASIPLFLCQLQFFKKFGTFLCLTIAFSWLFANFGFMSVLAQLKIPLKSGAAQQTKSTDASLPAETTHVLPPLESVDSRADMSA